MGVPNSDDRTLVEVVQARPLADILQRHPLAASQPRGFGCRQGQSRDVFQRGLDRKQIPRINQIMPTLRYGIQRNRLRFAERSDRKTAQLDDPLLTARPESGAPARVATSTPTTRSVTSTTVASFKVPGVYVVRAVASDAALESFHDITVTVR